MEEYGMNKHLLGGMMATAILWPTLASAQTTIIETTGVALPDEVVTYVQREYVPSVRVEREVRIGSTLPETVELRSVPRHDTYGYAIVNERRVIVEPRTRRVIRVVE
jgi:hypothetical protein